MFKFVDACEVENLSIIENVYETVTSFTVWILLILCNGDVTIELLIRSDLFGFCSFCTNLCGDLIVKLLIYIGN